MKRRLSIVLFCALVAILAAIFSSCTFFGRKYNGKPNSNGASLEVEDMPVKGTIGGEIYYEPERDGIVWDAVPDADYYLVKFGSEDVARRFNGNFAGVTYFSGDNVFSVFAVRGNQTKTEVKTQEFSKTELNLALDKAADSVTWTGDENATEYKIVITNADVKNAGTNFTVEGSATKAPLTFITSDYRYYVSVRSVMGKGTHLPAEGFMSDVRRVRSETFFYNGYTGSFLGFPDPIPGENATYTHHVTIGEDSRDITERSLGYRPTGGDFTASLYTESNRANYLNSVKQTITVVEKEPVTGLACDANGILTWKEAKDADGYRLWVNGVDSAGADTNSLDLKKSLPVGTLGVLSVTPYYFVNAYSAASDTISVFRRGSALKLEFFSHEPNFGEVGENRFTVTSRSIDTELKGVRFTVTGAENLTRDVDFASEGEVRNTSLVYKGFDFAAAGDYTITVTPRYELPAGTISIGEDSSASYAVTRLPDLTNVEVRNVEGSGKIFVAGATGGYVDIIDNVAEKKLDRSQPAKSGLEYYFDLFERTNTAAHAQTYSYSLYNSAYRVGTYEYYSWERGGLESMTLRSLGKADVSYRLVGKVTDITYNVNDDTISWGYDEEATFNVLDLSDGINVHSVSERTFDLSSFVNGGVFSDGAKHVIDVYVTADPDHGLFASGLRRKTLRGTPAPVLTLGDDTLEYLHISNNRSMFTMKTTYAVGPNAGQTVSKEVYYLTADHAGATIEIRNNGFYDSTNGVQYVNSQWVTYSVATPQATNTSVVCNENKTVSWAEVEHVSSYKYVIGGDGEASGDRVTNRTADLSSVLTGRKTYSITVSGYGSQDDKTFYLPAELLTDTFYCSSLEVWALKNGAPNTETTYTTGQTAIQFQFKIVPEGSGLNYTYCSVVIKDSNKPSEIYYYPPTAYSTATFDCTAAIITKPTTQYPFSYYMNNIGNRHAIITFTLQSGTVSSLLMKKSFVDKTNVRFALYKDYNDHSKYDIRFIGAD